MKKIFAILLSMLMMLTMLNGCNRTPPTDVWDGSVAETFASGDGSEKNPYTIEKASQLAFLAQEINGGSDYRKHFLDPHAVRACCTCYGQ